MTTLTDKYLSEFIAEFGLAVLKRGSQRGEKFRVAYGKIQISADKTFVAIEKFSRGRVHYSYNVVAVQRDYALRNVVENVIRLCPFVLGCPHCFYKAFGNIVDFADERKHFRAAYRFDRFVLPFAHAFKTNLDFVEFVRIAPIDTPRT